MNTTTRYKILVEFDSYSDARPERWTWVEVLTSRDFFVRMENISISRITDTEIDLNDTKDETPMSLEAKYRNAYGNVDLGD